MLDFPPETVLIARQVPARSAIVVDLRFIPRVTNGALGTNHLVEYSPRIACSVVGRKTAPQVRDGAGWHFGDDHNLILLPELFVVDA